MPSEHYISDQIQVDTDFLDDPILGCNLVALTGLNGCRECDDELNGTQGQQLLAFGSKPVKADVSSGIGRHAFFRAHKLQRVANF